MEASRQNGSIKAKWNHEETPEVTRTGRKEAHKL
jgi:hypothetical protein